MATAAAAARAPSVAAAPQQVVCCVLSTGALPLPDTAAAAVATAAVAVGPVWVALGISTVSGDAAVSGVAPDITAGVAASVAADVTVDAADALAASVVFEARHFSLGKNTDVQVTPWQIEGSEGGSEYLHIARRKEGFTGRRDAPGCLQWERQHRHQNQKIKLTVSYIPSTQCMYTPKAAATDSCAKMHKATPHACTNP